MSRGFCCFCSRSFGGYSRSRFRQPQRTASRSPGDILRHLRANGTKTSPPWRSPTRRSRQVTGLATQHAPSSTSSIHFASRELTPAHGREIICTLLESAQAHALARVCQWLGHRLVRLGSAHMGRTVLVLISYRAPTRPRVSTRCLAENEDLARPTWLFGGHLSKNVSVGHVPAAESGHHNAAQNADD